MRPFSATISLVAFAALTAQAPSAAADSPSRAERDRADALFEEAKALMARSRFLEACPKLVEARRIDPAAGGTILALALCHEGEQKLATALAELREAKKLALASKNADRERLANEHIEALAPHVSKIVLQGVVRGTAVRVDGAPVAGDGAVEVDGGEHVARAERAGRPAWEQRIDVATKDDTRVVEIPGATPPPGSGGAADAAPPAPSEPGQATHTRMRTTGLLVGGAGVVALGVGGYFGVRALGEQSDSRASCPSSPCASPAGVARHVDAQHDALAADVGIGVGVAALVGGLVLVLLDRKEGAPSATVTPTVSERSGGLAIIGRF